MIDLAATIEAMKASGMTSDEIVRALACVQPVAAPTRTARQERNRRYYEARKASEKRLKASEQDVSDGATPSPKESPQTPKETPPSEPTTPKENPLRGQKKAVRLPSDFVPNLVWAVEQGLSRSQAEAEAAKFRDYWTAKGRDAAKLDWPATWRNWVRSALERTGQPRAGPVAKPLNPTLLAAQELLDRTNAVTPSEIEGHHPPPRLVAIGQR